MNSVREYWSVDDIFEKIYWNPEDFLHSFPAENIGFLVFHYSDTPTLQKNIELGRTVAPLWGETKATSFGDGFFTFDDAREGSGISEAG